MIRFLWRVRSHATPLVLAGLLFTAAGLKARQFGMEPKLSDQRWFVLFLVQIELALGLWLVFRPYAQLARAAALVCFTGFATVSLRRALTGESSCGGCFGQAAINPWYTLVVDLVAIRALLCWKPMGNRAFSWSFSVHAVRFICLGLLFLGIGIPLAVRMLTFAPSLLTPQGEIIGDTSMVLMEPASWSGQRFPLLKHIDIGEQLARGKWIVFFYRHGCPACRDELVKLKEAVHSPDAPHVALIELPPFGGKQGLLAANFPFTNGLLSPAKHWFVETPLTVSLREGVTVSVIPPWQQSQRHHGNSAAPDLFPGSASDSTNETVANLHDLLAPEESQRRTLEFPDYRSARNQRALETLGCGPLSLIAILDRFAIQLSKKDRNQILSSAHAKGITLLELNELAQRYGLHGLGLEVSPTRLKEIGLPALRRTWKGLAQTAYHYLRGRLGERM